MTACRRAQKWSKGICPMRESLGINMRVTTTSGRWAIGYKDGHCTNMTTSCGDFSESGTWQPKIQSVQSVAVARTFSASVTFSPRHFSVSTDLLCRNSLVLKHQAEAFLHFETKRPALTFSDSRKTENRTSSCCVVWSSQQNQENHSNTQFRHSCHPLSPALVLQQLQGGSNRQRNCWPGGGVRGRNSESMCQFVPGLGWSKKTQEDSTQRSVPKDIEKYSNQSSLSSKCLKLCIFLVSNVFL